MIFRLRMSYLTSALLFCGSFNALASTISGTVSNELNEPVAGAKITLLEAMDTGQIVGRIVDLSSGAGVGGAQVFIDVKPELGGRFCDSLSSLTYFNNGMMLLSLIHGLLTHKARAQIQTS